MASSLPIQSRRITSESAQELSLPRRSTNPVSPAAPEARVRLPESASCCNLCPSTNEWMPSSWWRLSRSRFPFGGAATRSSRVPETTESRRRFWLSTPRALPRSSLLSALLLVVAKAPSGPRIPDGRTRGRRETASLSANAWAGIAARVIAWRLTSALYTVCVEDKFQLVNVQSFGLSPVIDPVLTARDAAGLPASSVMSELSVSCLEMPSPVHNTVADLATELATSRRRYGGSSKGAKQGWWQRELTRSAARSPNQSRGTSVT